MRARPVFLLIILATVGTAASARQPSGPRELIGLLSSHVTQSNHVPSLHSYSTAIVFADGSFLAGSNNGSSFESPFFLLQGILVSARGSTVRLSSLLAAAEAAEVSEHMDCTIDNRGVEEHYLVQWHLRSGEVHSFRIESRNSSLPTCEPEITRFLDLLNLYLAKPKPASTRVVVQ